MEFTIDCKVIYGFYLLLSKTLHCLLLLLSESKDEFWFGDCVREGFGKDDLRAHQVATIYGLEKSCPWQLD